MSIWRQYPVIKIPVSQLCKRIHFPCSESVFWMASRLHNSALQPRPRPRSLVNSCVRCRFSGLTVSADRLLPGATYLPGGSPAVPSCCRASFVGRNSSVTTDKLPQMDNIVPNVTVTIQIIRAFTIPYSTLYIKAYVFCAPRKDHIISLLLLDS